MKYRIKTHLAIRKIGNEIYIVDSKNSILHKINPTGSFIFERIKNNKSKQDIIKELIETYDVDYETASKDLEEFISQLISKNLIEKNA